MPLILGTNSIKDTGYDVANSLRFNDGSSDSLQRTPGSSGNRRTWTFSTWFKRGNIGSSQWILDAYGGSGDEFHIYISSGNAIGIYTIGGGFGSNLSISTNNLVRDVSAWYNLVVRCDTTQSTASDRLRIYLNGVEASYGTYNNFTLNGEGQVNEASTVHYLGRRNAGDSFDGYFAETVLVDGLSLDPTSFGEFDSDSPTIWKPIDVSGLTFGTNGFYLDFENASSLGADVSGNSNNFTVNNLTSVDQSSDSCTNNFATLNPLDAYYEASTFSEGNLKIVTESSGYSYNTSTIGLTTGKWYCEVYIEATPHSGTKDSMIGVAGRMSEADLGYLGLYSDTYGIYGGNGNIYNGGSGSSYGVSHTTGDIIGIYLDLDNNKLYFAKNGTLMNSGTGKDITAVSNTTAGAYFMVAADFYNGSSGTYRVNFGNPIYSLSSANADANGFGSFEYDPSSGTFDGSSKDFLAINTKNLAEFG